MEKPSGDSGCWVISTRFQVGQWEVFPNRGVISADGRDEQVEPRVMDLLVYLATRSGEVLPH